MNFDCLKFVACLDVAIVGAGISGTYAAWLLRQRDLKVGVFEQWDRVGGRLYTQRVPGDPELKAELGAMYYNPEVSYIDSEGQHHRLWGFAWSDIEKNRLCVINIGNRLDI